MTTNETEPGGHAHGRGRWLAVLALVVVAGAAGLWYYSATRPRPARLVRQDIIGQVPLIGTVVTPPDGRADIYAPFAAPVEEVAVSVGQHVDRGDLLVKLQVGNAEAYHEQTKQALKAAETAYANARSQLEGPVVAAQRQLDAARAAASAAPPGPDPSTAPAGGPSDATLAVAEAEAAIKQALAARDTQLIPYRQQLEAAREANRQARAGERQGEIRSPITGTVLALNAQPGKVTETDRKAPLVTVVDLSKLQIHASADPSQAAYMKPKQPVLLTFKEIPGKQFTASISNVTTRVEEKAAGLIKNQQLVAVIDFKNTDAVVRPGMTPVVAVKTGEVKDALAAPIEAVDTDPSGRPILHVMRGGRWTLSPVETGISDGRVVQIKSGAREGETIQVTPDVLHAAGR